MYRLYKLDYVQGLFFSYRKQKVHLRNYQNIDIFGANDMPSETIPIFSSLTTSTSLQTKGVRNSRTEMRIPELNFRI